MFVSVIVTVGYLSTSVKVKLSVFIVDEIAFLVFLSKKYSGVPLFSWYTVTSVGS